MTTLETVMTTETFKNSSSSLQNTLISKSVFGIFENANECKKAGYSYNEWLQETCAGATAKRIVQEMFAA